MRVQDYPLVSDQVQYVELQVIIDALDKVLAQHIEGDVVEFGCYEGTTSLFISRLLQKYPHKSYHVYDSFEGLPEKTQPDASPAGEQFKAGELNASKAKFIKHFRQANLALPKIHKGWFDDLTINDVPETICFAFLDGDFYNSIATSLHLVENRIQPGSIIVVDDYQAEALPGARRAVDEWLRLHPDYRLQVIASLAVIKI